jgi:hypothetical protein
MRSYSYQEIEELFAYIDEQTKPKPEEPSASTALGGLYYGVPPTYGVPPMATGGGTRKDTICVMWAILKPAIGDTDTAFAVAKQMYDKFEEYDRK